MGINSRVFELIVQYATTGGAALSAGYPDMLITLEDLRNNRCAAELLKDAHSDEIVKEHGVNIPFAFDAESVFAALGYSLDVIDICKERGNEIIFDLNYPVPLREYDLVVDHGTIEHCFNVAQAALNLANAVKVGGIIVQHLPMTMVNHGFYNLSPTWFHALYCEKNGFELLHLEAMAGGNHSTEPVPPHRPFVANMPNVLLTSIARKVQQVPISFPTQYKYRR